MNNNDRRKQILYNKTEFNNHLICQLPIIFRCCKCKMNNSIIEQNNTLSQYCLYCGTPNFIKKERKY